MHPACVLEIALPMADALFGKNSSAKKNVHSQLHKVISRVNIEKWF